MRKLDLTECNRGLFLHTLLIGKVAVIVLLSLSWTAGIRSEKLHKPFFKEILVYIDSLKNSSSDSIKAAASKYLLDCTKDSVTSIFIVSQLDKVHLRESDEIISTLIADPGGEIPPTTLSENILNRIDISKHPGVKEKILTAIRSLERMDSLFIQREVYRVHLFQKYALAHPILGLRAIRKYYMSDSVRVQLLNELWTVKEFELLVHRLEKYPRYHSAISACLREFTLNNEYGKNATNKISFAIAKKLEQYGRYDLQLDPLLGLEDSAVTTTIYSDSTFIQALNRGDILIADQEFLEISSIVDHGSNSQLPILISRYQRLMSEFSAYLQAYYIPEWTDTLIIDSNALASGEGSHSGLYTKRLSFNFIKQTLVDELTPKLGETVSTKVVEEVFRHYAMASFATMILLQKKGMNSLPDTLTPFAYCFTAHKLGRVTSLTEELLISENSELDYIGALYTKGAVKSIRVLRRLFNLVEGQVSEQCLVLTTKGRRKITYTGAIPLRLRELARINPHFFENIEYSFLWRRLRQDYGIIHPFWEFVDILNGNALDCINYFHNAIYYYKRPLADIVKEIRSNVSSGDPISFDSLLGLSQESLKPVHPKYSLRSVINTIHAGQIETETIKLFDQVTQNSKSTDYNFANYSGVLRANITVGTKKIYDYILGAKANSELSELMYIRASRLPHQSDCNSIGGFFGQIFGWCNPKQRREMNDKRQRYMNISSAEYSQSLLKVQQLSIFNILNEVRPNHVFPIATFIDTSDLQMTVLLQIEEGSKQLVVASNTSDSSVVTQIIRLDRILSHLDSMYMQRYNVDLSNCSDHGIMYFGHLAKLLIAERITNRTLSRRISREGFVALDLQDIHEAELHRAFTYPLLSNILLQHLYLLEEKRFLGLNRNEPNIAGESFASIQTLSAQARSALSTGQANSARLINSEFDKADRIWNAWVVGFNVTLNGNADLLSFRVAMGTFSVGFVAPQLGQIPFIPLPSMTISN